MRTFFSALLAVLAGIVAFVAIGTTLAWWIVGTPANAAATAVTLVQSDNGRTGLATLLLDNLLEDANPSERAIIERQRDRLIPAAGAGLAAAAPLIGDVVNDALTAVVDGRDAAVDPKPILNAVLSELHKVEPLIPAADDSRDSTMQIKAVDVQPLVTILTILNLWWVLAVVTIGLLVAAAYAGRHSGRRRWRVAGIALAVPALLWCVAGIITPRILSGFADSAPGRLLIEAAGSLLTTRILTFTVPLLLVAIALIVISAIKARAKAEESASKPSTP